MFFFIILYVFFGISNIYAKELEYDKTSIIINDQSILESDINTEMYLLKNDYEIIQIPLKINFLRDRIIHKLIIDTLILEEAKKNNIIVNENQVNSILKSMAVKNNVTLKQLKKNIILNYVNQFVSYNDYINNLKKLLTIQMVRDYVLKKRIHVLEKEIYLLFNKKIRSENESKKIDIRCIYMPFKRNNMYKNKILINSLMNNIKKRSSFNYFFNIFKRNHINNQFFTKKILSQPIKNIKKLFLNKFNFIKKDEVLGPFLGKNCFYIFKIDRIYQNSPKNIITEFNIQHCLIRPSKMLSSSEAKKNIFNIYNNIKNKKYNFDYAVKNFSHDTFSAFKNGNIGWINQNFFYPIGNKILLNLKENNISIPIQSRFGWHIIKLLEKREINKFSSKEKEKIYRSILEDKLKIEEKNWIRQLKSLSYIKIVQ